MPYICSLHQLPESSQQKHMYQHAHCMHHCSYMHWGSNHPDYKSVQQIKSSQIGLEYILQEIMAAMTSEKPGDCSDSSCGAECPGGKVETFKRPCSSNSFVRRCCSPGSYPDIFILIDKGQGSSLQQRSYNLPYADYSLLEGFWTNVKTVVALAGAACLQCWSCNCH